MTRGFAPAGPAPAGIGHWLGLLAVLALATAAAAWRYSPWMPVVFFGDDLANLLAFREGHFARTPALALFAATSEKYRPVWASAMGLLFGAFDGRLAPHLVLNVLLQGLNATLVFAIAHRLSRGNALVALAVALTAATSRFALYQVTQATGLLEGLALGFFLATFYCVVRAYGDEKSAWRWGWLAIAASFLTIHTHERYVVVCVWLPLALNFMPSLRQGPGTRRMALAIGCAAVLGFNVLYKAVVLHVPFFVGTGGTNLDFDALRSLRHLAQAVASVAGFNAGPDYLVGASLASLPSSPTWFIAAAFALAWSLAVAAGVRCALRAAPGAASPVLPPLYWPLAIAALGALLLLPPVLTIRVEQRWLLEPFILMLFVFAWAAGQDRAWPDRRVWVLLPVVLCASSIFVDAKIAPYFDRIFFVSSGQVAALVKRDIVDRDPGQSAPLALIGPDDHCAWTLLQGGFFRVYGEAPRSVRCFVDGNAFIAARPESATRVYRLDVVAMSIAEVTSDLQDLAQAARGTVAFDFVGAFAAGRINSTAKVSTPTGLGVLNMPWDTAVGRRSSLTVVSGFSYRYDDVPIARDTELYAGVAMIYPSREPLRAVVTIEANGKPPQVLLSRELKPPRPGEKPAFESIVVPLGDYAGTKAAITFAAETPPGRDSSGHWVAFADPRLLTARTP